MSGFANDVINATNALIRFAIRSPNFVHGVTGWSINKDGSAEFNNVTIRGSIFGTNFIISASGLFFYAATPALDNLIVSIVPGIVNVTDSVGNSAVPGVASYGGTANKWSAISFQQGGLCNTYIMATTDMNGTWTLQGQLQPSTNSLTPFTFINNGAGFAFTDIVSIGDTHNNISLQPSAVNLNSVVRGIYTLTAANSGNTIPFLFGGDPTSSATETWHDMRPLLNSFIGTVTSRYPPQYRRTVEGFVEIFGTIQFPATAGNYNNITFATLPSQYRPGVTGLAWPISLDTNVTPVGTATVAIDTSGNLQFHHTPTAGLNGTTAVINGRFPLDQTGTILV